MKRFFLLLCFLSITSSSFSQKPISSKERNALERCGFDESESGRYNCYAKALNDILIEALDKTMDRGDLKTNDTFQALLSLTLSEQGNFQLDSIKTKNKPLEDIVTSRLSIRESVLPITDSLGRKTAPHFVIPLRVHLNEEGEIARGLPKQQVGGFGDLIETVDFAIIEQVPIYPGCDQTTNKALKKCMSGKIQRLVIEKFDLTLMNRLNLPVGVQRIFVKFKIDKTGYIVDVKARAEEPALAAEAKRVVSLIPKMEPGRQKGKEVGVLYALPIAFKVEETAKQKRQRLKKERKARKKS